MARHAGYALAISLLASAGAARAAPGSDDAPPAGRWKLPDGVTLAPALRLQPRLDAGDLARSRDGGAYAGTQDLYLRRARLGLEGRYGKQLRFEATLEADRSGQAGRASSVGLYSATAGWVAGEAFAASVGKQKLPFSRVAYTSSARQLLPDRPFGVEEVKDALGGTTTLSVVLRGRLAGLLGWHLAAGDGWGTGETLDAAGGRQLVRRADPLVVGRIELSPPGWAEDPRSDAHLGEGRHLTLGLAAAVQRGISYVAIDAGEERRFGSIDLSGHAGPFTAQAELDAWTVDSSAPGRAVVKPRAVHVQGAFLVGAVEPAVRWERFEADAEAPGTALRAFTLGVNWYLRGHDLKLQAAWVHVRREAQAPGRVERDRTQDLLQLQGQLDL